MAGKIAVVGSRTFTAVGRIIPILDQLLAENGPFTVVSGGAEGPDSIAVDWAMKRGLAAPEVFLADWEKEGDAAGIKRNGKIVEACEILVAFWDGVSAGTLDSIVKARKAKKPVAVYLG